MKNPRPKPVTEMIARLAKHHECSESEAIERLLIVATGRLNALGRYAKSLPEGKSSKGVLTRTNKKIAPRSKPVTPRSKPVIKPIKSTQPATKE